MSETKPSTHKPARTRAFEAFLSTPEAQNAPQWQLDWLAGVDAANEWPDGGRPTCESFRRMRAALDTLERSAA